MSIDTNYADSSGRQFLAVNETQVEIPDGANAFAQWPDSTNIPRAGSLRTHTMRTGMASWVPTNEIADNRAGRGERQRRSATPHEPRDASIAGIDWTTALGPDPDRPDAVYYDGLTLRNANGKSLAEAADDLQARIDAVLRGRGINDDADATRMARRIRCTITRDPTLSLDPLPAISYGGPRWLTLWTGVQTLTDLGLSARNRAADELMALGRAAIRTRALRNAVQASEVKAGGMDTGGLLLMANAAGRIDLRAMAMAQSDATISVDQLTAHYKEVFADDLYLIDLLSELAFLELPLERHLSQAESRASDTDVSSQVDGVSLRDQFNATFDIQKTAISTYVSAIVDASIARYGKCHGIDIGDASVTIDQVQRRLRRDPGLHPAARQSGEPEENSRGYFVSLDTPAGKHLYFLSFSTGTELPLPTDVRIEDWSRENEKLVFGHPLATAACSARELASAKRAEISDAVKTEVSAAMEHLRATAHGNNGTDSARQPAHRLVPFRFAQRAVRGGYPYEAAPAAALDVLTIMPVIGDAVLRGSRTGTALHAGLELAFSPAAQKGVLRAIRNAATEPTDVLSQLRGGGRLTVKGIRALAQRMRSAHPLLADELTNKAAMNPAIADARRPADPAGDMPSGMGPAIMDMQGVSAAAGTRVRITRIINENAARDLDREVPPDTPNYRGNYDDDDAYAWSDDGEYQYTGFLTDTTTVALAEKTLQEATDLTHYTWWADQFDQFFDTRVVNLEASAYAKADSHLANATAAADQKSMMQDRLRTFLVNVYARSETFRGLVNEARRSGRIMNYDKWAIHIAAPETMSGGRSEYSKHWARADHESRTITVPDIQAPPEGMQGSTLTDDGTLVANAPAAVIIHELLHALTGKSDPPMALWDNDAAAITQGFPERGEIEYFTSRVLEESGIAAPRRLCYLHFGPEEQEVLRSQISARTVQSLKRYVEMQDAYLLGVFPNRNPPAAAWNPSAGNERWMQYQ
jgi:hypothetical protein